MEKENGWIDHTVSRTIVHRLQYTESKKPITQEDFTRLIVLAFKRETKQREELEEKIKEQLKKRHDALQWVKQNDIYFWFQKRINY